MCPVTAGNCIRRPVGWRLQAPARKQSGLAAGGTCRQAVHDRKKGEGLLKKRLVILFLALILPALLVSAEQAPLFPDISGYSVEELLLLQEKIQAELLNKGHNPYYDLERGDKGDAVLNIQEKLRELGYYDGPLSGKLDSETQKAFKRFEKDHGLPNDGLPSSEDQAVLFLAEAIIEPSAEPAQEETDDRQTETDRYQDYGPFDYQDCLRYPEKHDGEKVVLRGKILQVLGSRGEGFQIRLATAGDKDVVYVMIDHAPDFALEEDADLVVYARMQKTITYQSTWKLKITIPAAVADHIIPE